MEATTPDNLQSITVQGVGFEWEPAQGLIRVFDMPAITMWIESTLAGMMQGMQRMVGPKRFNLCMHEGGSKSIQADWVVIAKAASFEVGFAEIASYAVTCGWGEWRLHAIDRDQHEAVFRTHNNFEALYQKALGVDWGSNMTGGKFAGYCTQLFGVDCWATQTRFQANGDNYDEFVVRPSDLSLEQRHEQLSASTQATHAELAVALKRLEKEHAERKRAEQAAQEHITLVEKLSVPILEVWDGVLALPILGMLSGDRTAMLMERLLAAIQRTAARYAILDITGVDVVDTNTADHLLRVARAVELLGAQCIITGIQPAVAQTMVMLRADLSDITTRATLRHGLKYCMINGA